MEARVLTLMLVLGCSVALSARQAPGCQPDGDVQFVCGQQGPEDLVALPGSQWIVATAYSGTGGVNLIHVGNRTSIVAYPSAAAKEQHDAKSYPTCPGPPTAAAKAAFMTHGVSVQPGSGAVHRLYVVVHGAREAVEVFEVDTRPATPVLTWIGCAVAPEPVGLNSVRWLADGGFLASDFLARGADAAARTKMMAGEKNGQLWEWHASTGWRALPGSDAAGANGLEISADGRWIYVAAWGTQSFFRVARDGSGKRDEIPLGFRVDNIRWARDGSLIAAGQGGAPPNQTTNVVKIDPEKMTVREVLRRPNSVVFGGGTVALDIGDRLWIGSFRGDRIAIFPATP